MSRKRILIFQESWGRGGIETFVMNLLRGLDPDDYEVELLSVYDWDRGYDAELDFLGVRRTTVFPGCMPGLAKRFVRGTRTWWRMLSAGDVDIVHVNAMNGMTLAYVALARHAGVPVRVAHAHNNDFGPGARAIKLLFHKLGKRLWAGAATVRLACSQDAGSYLFGQRDFTFVPNGIDVDRFAFDVGARTRIRTELGIAPDALVVGSIGRISYQKNPLFSVRVLAELKRLVPGACLLLVGDGELVGEAQQLAEELGLARDYRQVASVDNPEDYYAAMDVYLMPSRFEGFGYVLVEAQCEGLPCIASEALQDEACVTDLVRRLPLEAGAVAWAQAVQQVAAPRKSRASYPTVVAAAGFSAAASVEALRSAYAFAVCAGSSGSATESRS
jgi:glycosyltransferase involved in cell wall biosynthesis